MPLRALYRRAVSRGDVSVNPTTSLELPAVRGRRDRIVSPDEAARLLGVLDERDRALWAGASLTRRLRDNGATVSDTVQRPPAV
jgi:hypothetical protein